MADRPPSREEVMFEWFVGDAKDILEHATALREELAKLCQQQEEANAAQGAALAEQHKVVIAAERNVVRAAKEGAQSIAQAAEKAGKDAQAVASQASRRIAAVA